jgi:hypothetical protein
MLLKYLLIATVLTGLGAAAPAQSSPQGSGKAEASPGASTEAAPQQQLVRVKRIYVDSFGEDPQSKQIQAMVVASLAESKRFVVTENKARADAVLKGAGEEKTSQEFHSYGESTAAGGFGGASTSSPGYHSAAIAGRSAAISDSGASTETIDRVGIAVRLVNGDGDVIWSTKQDSHGAKYKGATADVADKIVKQLTWAAERAERATIPAAKP